MFVVSREQGGGIQTVTEMEEPERRAVSVEVGGVAECEEEGDEEEDEEELEEGPHSDSG